MFSVTAIAPTHGFSGNAVLTAGSGFMDGATVSIGGAATDVRVIDSTSISAKTPMSGSGTVDVIVTNPSGDSATLARAYAFHVLILTPSVTAVAPFAR
jgi:hypothetical protein